VTVSGLFYSPYFFDLNNPNAPFPFADTGSVAVDLEIENAGFTFSPPAVPEPSTWAMLLIGFAAIGFAGYRKSWRESFMG
jgi:hypothetical protein